MNSIDGELICGVCLELFDDPLLLPCGHNFCKKCIFGVIESGAPLFGLVPMGDTSSYKCPVCQKSFSSKSNSVNSLPKNKALENIINLYQMSAAVDIFDTGWNSDLEVRILPCPRHDWPMDSFCKTCNLSACKKCAEEHHQGRDMKHRHKVFPIKDTAFKHQAEIAEALTEIKKRSINLNERLRLLKDLQEHMEKNEKSKQAELDQHVNTIMSAVRRQQETLKMKLMNDFFEIKKPVEDEIRHCNSLKTTMQQMMKKVSDIKRTLDTGLRISLMDGAKKQLNSLLCFDIAWSLKDSAIPLVELPKWSLDIQHVLGCISHLHWLKEDSKMKTVSTQTGEEVVTKEPSAKELLIQKMADTIPKLKTDTASGTSLFKNKVESKEKDKNIRGSSKNTLLTQSKLETTFGVGNVVIFGDKKRPKIKLNVKQPEVKLPETVETDGLNSDTDTSIDESVKNFTAEIEEHKPANLDTSHFKNINENLSLSAAENHRTELIEVAKLRTLETDHQMQQKNLISSKDRSSGMLTPVAVSGVKNTDHSLPTNGSSQPSANKILDVTVQRSKGYAQGNDETTFTVAVLSDTGVKPKVLKNSLSSQQSNNSLKSDGPTPGAGVLKNEEKTEPMECTYSSNDDDDNDKKDEQFLSQSLNRISFNQKKEARDDHRNSFPPDTVASRLILKPRAQTVRKCVKPKQRSPHQDAVAKFVARRRTSSPHIQKTVSSQSLRTIWGNESSPEFQKTLSSPAFSELVIGDTSKCQYTGEVAKDCPTCKDTDKGVAGQAHLPPEVKFL